jgi:hypothetical protein
MRLLNRVNSVLVFLFGIGLLSISPFATAVQAQTGQRITFGVNPTIFRAGQLASAELSISSVSAYPLTLSAGNTFIFFVDRSVGTFLSLVYPTVNSSSLLASDFTASLAPSQINITYIGQPKTFVFGDSLSLKVGLLASAQAGAGKLSLSSQFVSIVNGNLPFTTVSIVDFGNSGTSAVTHDQTLIGDGTGATPLGIAPGGVTTGDLATGAVTAPKISVPLALTSHDLDGVLTLTSSSVSGGALVANGGQGVGSRGVSASGFAAVLADALDLAGSCAICGNGHGVGLAGSFLGNVNIGTNGNLSVAGNFNVSGGTKNFKIDHPLDPENKYLYHAAIESSEVLNLYSGNITTDANGDAVVQLPDWFEALNRDFRYQLTIIGSFAQAIVANEIKDNRFTIKTNGARVKVSWQVIGVRSDPVMLAHPFKVEEDKAERERGYYLNPAVYGKPEEKGIDWARDPQLMEMLKQRRIETEQMIMKRKENH